MLRRAFKMFDPTHTGLMEKEKVRMILNTLGYTYEDDDLEALLTAEDIGGNTKGSATPSRD